MPRHSFLDRDSKKRRKIQDTNSSGSVKLGKSASRDSLNDKNGNKNTLRVPQKNQQLEASPQRK